MPKLPQSNQPIPNIQEIEFSKIASIAKDKRKQERKTTILTYFSIGIAAVGLILTYLTLVATEKANSANQAANNATNKLLQLQETVRHQQEQYLSYQAKNDSMSAIVAKMKAALKKHGIEE